MATLIVNDAKEINTTVKRLVKRRPARKQVEVGQIEKKQPEQTGLTYNIWYNKWAGGDKYDAYNAKEKSQSRVDIAKDSGYTRADGGNNAFICMFFARGCCPKGRDCEYLHRLPGPSHKLPDYSCDVFGRPKHADYRDDMGGVGSFNRMNRTLYVGKIKATRDVENIVERHFEEFGPIEKIKILQSRGIGFVTYVHEISAQFAKEAMSNQSLDNEEVLNVRWATEDPNPTAKVEEAVRLISEGERGVAGALTEDFIRHVREMDELEGVVEPLPKDPEDVDVEEVTDEPSAKRQKLAIEPPKPTVSTLLSSTALDSLKAVAALRQTQPQALAQKANPLGGLGDYGSDSE